MYSRRWSFWVNAVAASDKLGRDLRSKIYRRLGLNIASPSWGIGPHCFFRSAEINIGEGSFVNDHCYFENAAPITIGREVAIGPQVSVITSTHVLGGSVRRCGAWECLPVEIGDGCWIGARALLLPGVTIGQGSVVAAGAVVNSDCESNSLYAGSPARLIRRLDP